MIQLSAPLEGMDRAEDLLNRTADRLARSVSDPSSPATGDSVDLSAEMLNLLEARDSFAANVKVAHAADEMARATLDLFG